MWLCWKGYRTQKILKAYPSPKLFRVFAWRITGVAGNCSEFWWSELFRVSGVRKKYRLEMGKIVQSLRLFRVLIWVFWE